MLKRQGGFSLIESLISMLVMAIGLLGLAALQIKSVQFSQASMQQSMAAIQATDMAERLWSNLCALNDEAVTQTLIEEWSAEHGSSMPGWEGDVRRHDAHRYTIEIQWQNVKVAQSAGGEAAPLSTLAHEVELPVSTCTINGAN